MKPASHERQDRQRLVVEPLRVADDHEDGLHLGGIGQQGQHGQRNEVRVGRVVVRRAQHGLQRESLRTGQCGHAAHEWEHELVHAREAEGHLGLAPRDVEHPEVARGVDRVAKQ